MLSEAIDKIGELAAATRQTVAVRELESKQQVALSDGKGGAVILPKPVPCRSHQVSALSSFTEAHRLFATAAASVWVTMTRVVALLDHGGQSHRCDTVTMSLSPHHAFAVLRGESWLKQKAMVDLLRHQLCDCEVSPDGTLAALRNLKFAVASESTGKFTNTSAALGKSVTAEVTGEVALPEVVGFTFHPFPGLSDELDVNVSIFCTLFTDPEKGELKLSPQPGQLEEAERKALGAVQGYLLNALENVPVLLGTP